MMLKAGTGSTSFLLPARSARCWYKGTPFSAAPACINSHTSAQATSDGNFEPYGLASCFLNANTTCYQYQGPATLNQVRSPACRCADFTHRDGIVNGRQVCRVSGSRFRKSITLCRNIASAAGVLLAVQVGISKDKSDM